MSRRGATLRFFVVTERLGGDILTNGCQEGMAAEVRRASVSVGRTIKEETHMETAGGVRVETNDWANGVVFVRFLCALLVQSSSEGWRCFSGIPPMRAIPPAYLLNRKQAGEEWVPNFINGLVGAHRLKYSNFETIYYGILAPANAA